MHQRNTLNLGAAVRLLLLATNGKGWWGNCCHTCIDPVEEPAPERLLRLAYLPASPRFSMLGTTISPRYICLRKDIVQCMHQIVRTLASIREVRISLSSRSTATLQIFHRSTIFQLNSSLRFVAEQPAF